MTGVPHRDSRLSAGAFGLCALACAGFFVALLTGKCRVCSASPWGLPFGGVAIWMLAGWVECVNPLIGLMLAIAATVGHAGLIVADWSGACNMCLAILTLEGIACAFVALRLKPWSAIRAEPLWGAAFLLAASGAGAAGAVVIPDYLYSQCPDAYRRVPAPDFKRGEPTFLLFVEPECPYCAQLRQSVLPSYAGTLRWIELSRCTAAGRTLMKIHRISSFPTLIVVQDERTLVDAEGVDEIRVALRGLTRPAPSGLSDIPK